MRKFHLAALILSTAAGAASAQAVRTERNMSLELANQIAAYEAAGNNVAAIQTNEEADQELAEIRAKDELIAQREHVVERRRGRLEPCRQQDAHPLPRAGRLGEVRRLPEQRDRLGAAPLLRAPPSPPSRIPPPKPPCWKPPLLPPAAATNAKNRRSIPDKFY